MVILTPKMVENILELFSAKNHNSNFADSPFDPIIVQMQMHPSLHLPISNINQCILKIFQIIVDLKKMDL